MGEKLSLPVWFVLAVRLLHLSLVRSWFVPDEYWQSLEVAHNIVFGYGYMTWEWAEGIRSYLYVSFIAAQYYLLHILHLDYVQLLIFLPRLTQTLISVLADVYLIRWVRLMSSSPVAWLASLVSLASACFAYCATRTLINTVEMNLTCIALYYYPWAHVRRKHDTSYLWVVGVCCMLRPTSFILWCPLCLYDVLRAASPSRRILHHFIPVGASCVLGCVLLDSWFHGGLLLTPWNFLRLNVLSGVSGHYSTHPWHWYLTAGIPSVLGTLTVPFYVYGVKAMVRRKCHHASLFAVLVWCLLVYSCIGHKEFRFLLSLYPILLLYSSLQLYSCSQSISTGWMVTLVSCMILVETALLLFLSLFHQVGSLNAMPMLRARNISSEAEILFLMPCHSTPLYSHLHVNISTRILTCEPNLSPHDCEYQDEADVFYQDPVYWLYTHYGNLTLTGYKSHWGLETPGKSEPDEYDSVPGKSHFMPDKSQLTYIKSLSALPHTVVCFDSLVSRIQGWLTENGFELQGKLFHTYFPLESRLGKYVMVYARH